MEIHNIPPIYDGGSRVLILGSFPSVRSRGEGFYYAHPRNRFWQVLSAVFGCGAPHGAAEKTAMLLSHRAALWDAAASCELRGSSDSSIRNAVPNDLSPIFAAADIRAVFCNGATARRLISGDENRYPAPFFTLPSTSPANASYSLEALIRAWSEISVFLRDTDL